MRQSRAKEADVCVANDGSHQFGNNGHASVSAHWGALAFLRHYRLTSPRPPWTNAQAYPDIIKLPMQIPLNNTDILMTPDSVQVMNRVRGMWTMNGEIRALCSTGSTSTSDSPQRLSVSREGAFILYVSLSWFAFAIWATFPSPALDLGVKRLCVFYIFCRRSCGHVASKGPGCAWDVNHCRPGSEPVPLLHEFMGGMLSSSCLHNPEHPTWNSETRWILTSQPLSTWAGGYRCVFLCVIPTLSSLIS